MSDDPALYRRKGLFLAHLADSITADGFDNERARELALELKAAASELKQLQELLASLSDESREAVQAAQKSDDYDGAYEGFCDGMRALRYADDY
jgi:hypothetical protein